MPSDALAALQNHARAAAQRAHVPFSGQKAASALLLSDGAWVPGVRVESAAFSLTIPPLLNALTTAVAAGRRDVVAAALSRPFQPAERAFWQDGAAGPSLRPAGRHALVAGEDALPAPQAALDPLLPGNAPADPENGVAQARAVAERALVPASGFSVGCVLAFAPGGDSASGALVPGVNVEPLPRSDVADWTRVLCAERCALGTACSYGLLGNGAERAAPPRADGVAASPGEGETVLYLSCPDEPEGSPCGACRQLLAELLPGGVLWMDRAPTGAPERTSPSALLPGSFRGSALSRHAPDA